MWTVNFLMFKLVLEKAEEPEIKLPTSIGSSIKQESSRKNICFIDYAKAFNCVDHNKLWKILQEMGIPDHITCLPRNLYAVQEARVRTRHGSVCWWIPSSHHTVSSRTCCTNSHTLGFQCLPKDLAWLSLEVSDILFCIVNLSFSLSFLQLLMKEGLDIP